ncbi:hypothetical protein BGW37DRAFT_487111 [Umbelopsis sp. PMI_123]|nr:hypothetical protein BGW37DRAFT_487111 [Umbelopsis sp. PMI_123]
MSTESTRLISKLPTQYLSIPFNSSNSLSLHPHTPFNLNLTWVHKLYDYYSASNLLENRGCVARDHLANERTYLAYLRTSLATISTGVAITQLFRMNKALPDKPIGGRALGASLITLGIILLLVGTVRFFHSQEAMTRGVFPVTTRGVMVISVPLLVMCIAILFLN